MSADVARLDISNRRRSLIGYSTGMALYALVIVALYPAFKDQTSIDNLVRSGAGIAALFGISGSLTSPGGWLNANYDANIFPLIMLMLTIGYGSAAIAGQDEDGTLGLVTALPMTRVRIVLEKAAAMTVMGLVLAVAVAACTLVGPVFQLSADAGAVIAVSVSVLLMGLDFGLVAMAIGAARGQRGPALGVATALAAASYLVSSMAPVVSWLEPARYASLFYWSVGDSQIAHGVSAADYGVLIGVALVALAATVAAFRRLDLH
jgi:ABC-2 type transport system permease protein